MRIPQGSPGPLTTIGSLVHSVLEVLRNPRHRPVYDLIVAAPFDYTRSPALVRLVRAWTVKHQLPDKVLESVNEMLRVALTDVNFHHEGAIRVFPPEHEFTLYLGDGDPKDPSTPVVRGFIDSLAEYPEGFLLRDWKSTRQKYLREDVPSKLQALIYILYIWKAFRKPARCEFVFLRHAPTARTPDKHIQTVGPLTEDQLAGLEAYLIDMYRTVNSFGLEEALSHPMSDKDSYFCANLCPYLRPMEYWAAAASPDAITPDRTFPMSVDKPSQSQYTEGTQLYRRSHKGCEAKWQVSG